MSDTDLMLADKEYQQVMVDSMLAYRYAINSFNKRIGAWYNTVKYDYAGPFEAVAFQTTMEAACGQQPVNEAQLAWFITLERHGINYRHCYPKTGDLVLNQGPRGNDVAWRILKTAGSNRYWAMPDNHDWPKWQQIVQSGGKSTGTKEGPAIVENDSNLLWLWRNPFASARG